MSRFLAGALLAMDARHLAGKPVMLPVATAQILRKWIAEAIRDEQERDVDHSLDPAGAQSVTQGHAGERELVLISGPAPGARRGEWSQGSDDQTATADVGSTPAA